MTNSFARLFRDALADAGRRRLFGWICAILLPLAAASFLAASFLAYLSEVDYIAERREQVVSDIYSQSERLLAATASDALLVSGLKALGKYVDSPNEIDRDLISSVFELALERNHVIVKIQLFNAEGNEEIRVRRIGERPERATASDLALDAFPTYARDALALEPNTFIVTPAEIEPANGD